MSSKRKAAVRLFVKQVHFASTFFHELEIIAVFAGT